MKKRNYSLLTIIMALVLCCAMLVGCGLNVAQSSETTSPDAAEAKNTEIANPSKSGVLLLKVNPEIAVSYDEAGLVTDITGRNPEGSTIVENYVNYVGKDCRTVISELVTFIADAGYFVDSVDSERKTITIELEPGSVTPNDSFLENIVTEVETKVAANHWNSTVKSDSTDRNVDKTTPPTDAAETAATDIGADEAKSIALKHAGVEASAVTFARTEKDYDNGRLIYEVEFYSPSMEYDYEIDASTGAILSYDHDAEYYTKPTAETGNSTNYIGVEKAKTIALNHAGLSADDVSFSKAKFDDDDGRKEYEIEFYYNGTEYDYTIDASSGNIVEYDIERDD